MYNILLTVTIGAISVAVMVLILQGISILLKRYESTMIVIAALFIIIPVLYFLGLIYSQMLGIKI